MNENNIAIRVNALGKEYRIGEKQASYRTLRETLMKGVKSPFRKAAGVFHGEAYSAAGLTEEMWALRNVSFEVKKGEVLGIIGRNGAGKTTLLKILSRITEPTEGSAEVYGRVGSLLEVGTGMHPELTGRENIYLNGAILGMKRAEIIRKFDEIVDFSGVERFIDTPMKHYSSGMQVRLAFSIAAHLEPEILLIDEVLAVGDADFQKKCLGMMDDVARVGRTVFFVSHNMAAITRLCPRVILLDEGGVSQDGPTQAVIKTYLKSDLGTTAAREWTDSDKASGNTIARLLAVRVVTEEGQIAEVIDIRRPVGIEMEYRVLQAGNIVIPNFNFSNEEGICAFVVIDQNSIWGRKPKAKGRYISTVWVPGNFLAEGNMIVGAAVSTLNPAMDYFCVPDAVAFQVVDSLEGDSARGDYVQTFPGVVRPVLDWTIEFTPDSE
jgi:lipopolysaccharide transport system ATP-binding protein